MQMDKLTVKTREALNSAQTSAERQGHPEVTTGHILQALLKLPILRPETSLLFPKKQDGLFKGRADQQHPSKHTQLFCIKVFDCILY